VTRPCSHSKPKDSCCAASSMLMQPNWNGASAGCWPASIGSRSTRLRSEIRRQHSGLSPLFARLAAPHSRASPARTRRFNRDHRTIGVVRSLDWRLGTELVSLAHGRVRRGVVGSRRISGRAGWGRLTSPGNQKGRPFTPLRTSSSAFLGAITSPTGCSWSGQPLCPKLSEETREVLALLQSRGALFFSDLVGQSHLFPSKVEQALIELIGLDSVTADSFDGVRALLVPSDHAPPSGRNEGKRRHKRHLASIEFAGRWWLLGRNGDSAPKNRRPPEPHRVTAASNGQQAFAKPLSKSSRGHSCDDTAWFFAGCLDRESIPVSWYEVGQALSQPGSTWPDPWRSFCWLSRTHRTDRSVELYQPSDPISGQTDFRVTGC